MNICVNDIQSRVLLSDVTFWQFPATVQVHLCNHELAMNDCQVWATIDYPGYSINGVAQNPWQLATLKRDREEERARAREG